MRKSKCLKKHDIAYIEQICQVGRTFWRFDYCETVSYCHFCNKIRVQRNLHFRFPKILNKKDGLPF